MPIISSTPARPTALGLAALLMMVATTASAITVDELVHHIDRLWHGETSQATMTMQVRTQRYQREMQLEAWSLGKDYSLVVIERPIKDRGIATLKVEENIWNYLPKIDRVTRIPSSMMSGSWMGSHFTHDDLVRESYFEDDYESSITFEGERDGCRVWELTAVPRPEAPVVWGRVVLVIEQETLAPITARYYDEADELVRTMTFDEVERVDERWVPMRLTLQPEDNPDESTVIRYDEITFGVELERSFFSLQNLERRR
ncbi:MAG: outer membrane lipoprotein-sorting protein [Pseudomonadota bacterium]